MTLKTDAVAAYDTVVDANEAAAAANQAAVQTAARNLWCTVLAQLATCATTNTGVALINLAPSTPADVFGKLSTGVKVAIGTVAQYQSGTGLATSDNAIVSSDSGAKTVTVTTNVSRPITSSDYVFIHGIYAPISALSWDVTGMESTGRLTVESMNFRYRATNPAALEVESAPSAGAVRWLSLSSLADLGAYLTNGDVV